MAACCGVPRCSCSVIAGPGVTVDGNGSAVAPYIITVDPVPTPMEAADTATVDMTVSGTGAVGDPYVVSADVILDPTPPGGGDQLLQSGPDGLFLECEQVRGCISAGDGAAYDPATGVVSARLSADPGNTTALGTDGGLYTPAASTALEAADSPTVDLEVTGTGTAADPYTVTADVILDPTPPGGGTQLLQSGPDGLFLECEQVRGCLVAGDGIAYDPATGEIAATPAPTELGVTDSPTVDLTLTGDGSAGTPYNVTAAVILDPAPPGGGAQLLQSGPDGLFLECEQVRGCISAGDGATYDPATGVIEARLSADAGNSVAFGTDGGLYAPPAAGGTTALTGADSTTVDVTVTGTGAAGDPYEVTAAVILDPTPPGGGAQLLQAGPDGLFLECEQVRGCLVAGDGIAYDPATGEIAATPDPTALGVTDSPTVDLTLTGDGSAATPYNVTAAVILDPTPPGGGAQLLQSGPDGLFLECEQVRGCLVAGQGAAYDDTNGEIEARLSGDAGNTVVFGADGGLFVPAADLPLVGCGLTGDGTAGAPITVVPAAGSEAWPWACDVAVESTLKCDPGTGELWTPPEHFSAMDHIYVEHFLGGWLDPIGPTGGWAIIDPGANQQFNIPPFFIGNNCRPWGYEISNSVTWDIEHTANAVFELGMVVQQDGGAFQVRPMFGHLTAVGQAHRERGSGTANESLWNIPASSGASCIMLPAINVIAGQVTAIHSWVSDATIDTQTNTP